MSQTPALKSLLPLLLAAGPLLFPLPAGAEPSVPVRVTNLPATQAVAGTVNIGNTVPVTVTNAPATQAVTGTVNIGNPVQVSGPVTVTGTVDANIAPGSVSATLAPGAVVAINNGTSYQLITGGKNNLGVILPNPATAGQQLVIDSLFISGSEFAKLPRFPTVTLSGTHLGVQYFFRIPCQTTDESNGAYYEVNCNLLQTGIVLPAGEVLQVSGLTPFAFINVVQFSRVVPAN